MEWVIVVAQEVVGKSKFPHSKVGKFSRYKPWAYSAAEQQHRIIYARSFLASEEEAVKKAEQVSEEMFKTFLFGLNDTKHASIRDFTVLLHNVTSNSSRLISTTLGLKDSDGNGAIFPGRHVNNKNLRVWGIIKGLY